LAPRPPGAAVRKLTRAQRRHVLWGLSASLTALALLPACGANGRNSGTTSTSATTTTTAATAVTTTSVIAAPAPTQAPKTAKWVDLQVGDCLADPAPSDPSVVSVTIVDCATPHQAEVYLRAPMAVNTAIGDVADRDCVAGFPRYTGRPVAGSPFAVTYLIDSDQDRTSFNPAPSTVICLLQSANGGPLTQSARR